MMTPPYFVLNRKIELSARTLDTDAKRSMVPVKLEPKLSSLDKIRFQFICSPERSKTPQ
jgi:hypothetical protein